MINQNHAFAWKCFIWAHLIAVLKSTFAEVIIFSLMNHLWVQWVCPVTSASIQHVVTTYTEEEGSCSCSKESGNATSVKNTHADTKRSVALQTKCWSIIHGWLRYNTNVHVQFNILGIFHYRMVKELYTLNPMSNVQCELDRKILNNIDHRCSLLILRRIKC